MPSVVNAPLISNPGFMLKEKHGDSLVSAFTAVNGRTSPPSPHKLNGNGMSVESIHVRPLSRQSPDQSQDQALAFSRRDGWNSAPRVSENGHLNGHHSVSPPLRDQDRPPNNTGKRKRSGSVEDDHSQPSSAGSPETVASGEQSAMEHPQSRTLPPMNGAESERNWSQSQDVSHSGYQNSRDVRPMEHPQDNSNPTSHMNGDMSNGFERRSSTTEITRAGVQVDPKKRKRQFANRTKTGCGTCRRRKKKCDEAKPECNNCQRGGFICEGYAHKVPWPKNGVQKPHPPLQAKDRFPADHTQLYHSHGTNRESYPDSNPATDGARGRPIVVEEHDRQLPRNGWSNNSWGEPRASYPPEQQHPNQEYSQPPTSSHGRPPSNDHHAPHPTQTPAQSRQHNPRIYHHTPQTMSQVVNNSPVVTAEAALHHQSQQPHQQSMAQPTSGPPAPPPAHYPPPPPRPQKTEKEKMLSGEPFVPYSQQLIDERENCKRAVFRYNNTSNSSLTLVQDERDRHFRSILSARWTRPFHEPAVVSHLGREVFIEPPFTCDYGYNMSIGDRVDIGMNCKFLDSGRITIGRDTTIGANVTIDTQRTPTDSKSLKGSRRTVVAAEIHIGENVHIGANCTITAGVRIGLGAIIHPGSVVVRDIPPHCIARGNPAEVRSVSWDD